MTMQSVAVILLVVPFFVQGYTLIGERRVVPLTEKHMGELIQRSVNAINSQMYSPFLHKAVGNATIISQVGLGIIYRINLDVAETDCRNYEIGKECNVKKDDEKMLNCEVDILEQGLRKVKAVTLRRYNPK